ncbi:MAG: hypothetical protein H7246_10215 [Phycisphaerae bacterium]|nr:hypothetical protein [Saprospiraceae bacterium]
MKRLFLNHIIPIFACLAIAQNASAQWNLSHNPIFPIDLNANVGIGTSTPTQKLQLKGGNILLDYASGVTTGNLFFGGVTAPSPGTPANGMRLSFFNPSSNKNGYIDVRTSGSTTPNDGLVFRVDGINGGTERMRIRADNGNIGIGTSVPGHKLHVNATASANSAIVNINDSEGRRIFFVPKLGTNGYNNLSLSNDAGIFWADKSIGNTSAGFVIAPHQNAHWAGMRLHADGKTTLPGYNTTIGNGIGKLGIGHAYGTGMGYGTSYLGFNAVRSQVNGTPGTFTFDSDGANNGGNVIWGDVGGRIRFATEASTGAASKTLTDDQVLKQTKMSIGPDGKVTIGDNTNNGSMDLNFGQIPSGEGIGSKRAYTPGGNLHGLDFYTAGANRMRIENNGKVVIGPLETTTPGNYNLYVKNGILTELVKIAVYNTANWADYVFSPDYKLKPLHEVEAFVKENKHLPNVPSAQEIVENGLDLAQMQAKQMEKIEELTLYLIEMKKEIEALKTENVSLKTPTINR